MITENIVKLNDICTINSGVYLREPNGIDICYLQASDINEDEICSRSKRIVFRPQLNGYLLQQGDLLLVSKGSSFKCRVFDSQQPTIASTSFLTIRIMRKDILPEYLCWFLNHPHTVTDIRSRQEVASTPMIRKADIEDISVPIPTIDKQQSIIQLSALSQREAYLMKTLADRRQSLMNKILYNTI